MPGKLRSKRCQRCRRRKIKVGSIWSFSAWCGVSGKAKNLGREKERKEGREKYLRMGKMEQTEILHQPEANFSNALAHSAMRTGPRADNAFARMPIVLALPSVQAIVFTIRASMEKYPSHPRQSFPSHRRSPSTTRRPHLPNWNLHIRASPSTQQRALP